MERLPSGLYPILGIAYFSNVHRNIGRVLPSENDRRGGIIGRKNKDGARGGTNAKHVRMRERANEFWRWSLEKKKGKKQRVVLRTRTHAASATSFVLGWLT